MLRTGGRMRTALASAALTALCAAMTMAAPAGARAEQELASLRASFTPDRLGVSTTIRFGFHLRTVSGLAPPPLTDMTLRIPAGMNYTLTTLGLATCQPAALQASGVAGCPANSRLGSGSALVEVPFGTGSGHELPEIQAVTGPSSSAGNMVVLFYANGTFPVSAQLVFTGEVLPDHGAFGSQLATAVPLIPSVPGGPDVSIVEVSATIGPAGLTYYRHVHGRLQPFHPLGIGVPERCPRGGFPFSASFTFQDGTSTSATARVPCPRTRRG